VAQLSDIALHKAQRGLIIGGTGSGKSTLAEVVTNMFEAEYPTGRTLIADTKPRFRAEWELNGRKAAHRYKHWDHGAPIPGSYVLDLALPDFGMSTAWKLGAKVVIAQSERMAEWPIILDVIDAFFREARANRPQLLYVDELMDFFQRSGHPLKGASYDSILRSVRAGRERGLAVLTGSQRPVGIPVQIVSELTKLYLFRLDNENDIDHLEDFGIPANATLPHKDRDFYYYDKTVRRGGLYRLKL
jgi:energy-coupling factor transporter ATP-binding protein EcfA2